MVLENSAVLLTPGGAGAIAVVRLAGTGVGEFLKKHFSRSAAAGRCVHGNLVDEDRVIDDPVVVLAPDGRWADLNLHGGPWVVRAALELARRKGFRIIEKLDIPLAGEAVEGESLLECEMLAHLPLARTELALRVLLAQPVAWGGMDFLLMEEGEAGLAPTEEKRAGLKPAPTGQSKAEEGETSLAPTGQSKFIGSADVAGILGDWSLWWLLHPPRVAIVGAANVGKSTLANQLFAQERSITADLPGTTRDWVGEIANLDGLAVMLIDTPGIRPTNDPIEQIAIQHSQGEIRQADLVVLVLDASRPLEPEQSPLLRAYPRAMRVINKSDRPATWDISRYEGLHTVATSGVGIDALREKIRSYFGCHDLEIARPRWWTQRQRESLLRLD